MHRDRGGVAEVQPQTPAQQFLFAEGLTGMAGEEGQRVEFPHREGQRSADRRASRAAGSMVTGPNGSGGIEHRHAPPGARCAEAGLDPYLDQRGEEN